MFDPQENHVQQVEDKTLSPSPWTIPNNWTTHNELPQAKVDSAADI